MRIPMGATKRARLLARLPVTLLDNAGGRKTRIRRVG